MKRKKTHPIVDPKLGLLKGDNASDLQQTFLKLSESERKYKLLADNSDDLIAIITTDGTIRYASPSHYKILGYHPSQIENHSILDVVHPTHVPGVISGLKQLLKTKKNVRTDLQLIQSTGNLLWVEVNLSLLRDTSVKEKQILVSARDITLRKNAEERLEQAKQEVEESEEKFRAMADNIPNLAWMADAEGNIFWYNSRWYEYTGKTWQQIQGWGWESVHDKKVLPEVLHRWKHSLKTAQPFEMTFPLRGRDKKYRMFLTRVVPVKNSAGNLVRWFGSNTDITEQKKVEESLKLSEEQFRSTFNQSAVAIAMVDLRMRWINMNDAYPKMFGYTKEELMTKSFKDITHPDDIANDLKQSKRMIAREIPSHNTEKRYICKNGNIVWGLVHAAVVRDEEGNPKYITSVVQDITERKKLEIQKDEFTGIASHELKTPVTSIKAYGQVLEAMFRQKGDSEAAGLLQKMDQQINRLQTLIEDLLDVTKIESGKLQMHQTQFNLSELVKDRVEEMQRITEKHTLVYKASGSFEIFADRERVGQVLINFISNAIKYSPNASKITITCSQKKDSVVVSVKDQGIGIPAIHQAKLFDQFYRVTGPHENTYPGLGLGLYISKEIIQRSGGDIWCKSASGHGSTFYFSIPLHTPHKSI